LKRLQSLICGRKIQLEQQTLNSERGTPQGGRASPLLYRIGSNDLLTKIKQVIGVRPTAYADDTTLVIGADSLRELEEIT
ncbi:reverse transcriptase domain-containing protein, partial [Enterococcus gallinarum]|uniref:reverse transcriptase domain-containing protein n=1 Tax=Enterococcus gallinarum TaxID=1353 RepID=UPI003D09F0C6